MADHNNLMWIGHQAGLTCIDRSSLNKVDLTPFLAQLPLAPQYVQSLYEDHLGRIWIGTQGFGLFLIHEDKMFSFNTDNGLANSTINGVVEDDMGQFWVSSNKGLSRVIISETEGKIPQLAVKTFTKDQGLQGFQYMPMSFFKTKSGELYFGGVNGYNKFNPSHIQDNDFFPAIMISDLSVRSKNKEGTIHWPLMSLTSEKEEISLNYQYRDISVDFWGKNFIDPGNTFYRYRLINFDNGWINIGTQHTINFNFLPSGKYELQLQATTNPETWDTKYQSLQFTILPPWWMTAWAFSGYLFLLMLLLTIFFRLSKRWVNLNNQLAMEHLHREKEEELHQRKLKFFTDVSHELRTPLTLIVSPLEQIIKQPDLNSRLRNQLTLIQLNGARMMRLINKVLDLRRLDAEYDRLQAAEGDLVKFLKETSLAFKETANIKNIDFGFESEESLLLLYFDRDKMEMILYNLLSNAIKNTPEHGNIKLKLMLADVDAYPVLKNKWSDGQRFAVISVADSGRGIPADLQDRIFERFFVSSPKERRFPLDSGVGLELTKRLVELHKGHITLESLEKTAEKEGYSCFSVLFPLGKDHLAEEELIVGFKNSEDSSLYSIPMMANEIQNELLQITDESNLSDPILHQKGKITILVVEDNREVRTFIKSLFTGQYTVEEAGDGKEGWEKATESVPDLIICDIMMPEMDGMELCKRIKTDIRTSHIPVILLTARTAITFKYEGLETGADDYITKPFSAEYLQLRVQNLIRQREILRNHFALEMICDPAKITVTSVDEKLLKKAVDYIGEHMPDSSLSVRKLSDELGLSRVHLYRKIKALTNLTAVEFVRSIRLKRAASLLQENRFNINEISTMVGMDDVDYFRICFKKQFGYSPSEYAKKCKNERLP
jgi:signal transduction histidine kinase/DNA-binding response OmpR family regulator